MSNILITKLNRGAGTLLERAIDLFGVDIHSFVIGDAFDFVPDPSESAPRGQITFTGDRSLVKVKYFDNDMSMRISMVIPEDYNNVRIGNVVAYAFSQGQIVPILSIVLPNIVTKTSAFPELEPEVKFKYPSSRLVISAVVQYVEETPFDQVTINLISPEFSNLHFYGHSNDIPLGGVNPHQQFILNQMDGAGATPAFVTKDADDSYWTTPLWQDLNSPKFGIIDGGVHGQGYDEPRMKWLWGGMFSTDNTEFGGMIGGGDLASNDPESITIGFAPF